MGFIACGLRRLLWNPRLHYSGRHQLNLIWMVGRNNLMIWKAVKKNSIRMMKSGLRWMIDSFPKIRSTYSLPVKWKDSLTRRIRRTDGWMLMQRHRLKNDLMLQQKLHPKNGLM